MVYEMFPGSDSHNLIGILAITSLGSETGVAHNVPHLGELEIIGIYTIDIILIRLRGCSWAFNIGIILTKNHLEKNQAHLEIKIKSRKIKEIKWR